MPPKIFKESVQYYNFKGVVLCLDIISAPLIELLLEKEECTTNEIIIFIYNNNNNIYLKSNIQCI